MPIDQHISRRQQQARFQFGRNWTEYNRNVTEAEIAAAQSGIEKLLPSGIHGRSVFDVGCGSGIHSLGFLRLGSSSVTAVDYDPICIETAARLVGTRYFGAAEFICRQADALALPEDLRGTRFDIVYSWGVLHHTGNLWRALESVSAVVAPHGLLVIAIYHKTPFCALWRREKAWYSNASTPAQAAAQLLYKTAFYGAKIASGRNPFTSKPSRRGMKAKNDLHDWLGGFPYESATPDEIRSRLNSLGFRKVREFIVSPPAFGIFGTGCDEYVYKRNSDEDVSAGGTLP
jgi:2-polyprenyl-6-hydroxyphenyl methylase/3-demethylubiquinone-9 3-methyltransferase